MNTERLVQVLVFLVLVLGWVLQLAAFLLYRRALKRARAKAGYFAAVIIRAVDEIEKRSPSDQLMKRWLVDARESAKAWRAEERR